MSDQLVLTPGGYRPKSKVHHVESTHAVRRVGDRHKKIDPAGNEVADLGPAVDRPEGQPVQPRHVVRAFGRTPNLGSGWIAFADWTNITGLPITSFATTWTVPAAPRTQSGQTIFLFNGIQNSSMIYQPVLQWGPSAAGGGSYWAVASWYADGQGGTAYYTTPIRVSPGDVLVGVMTLTAQSPSGFSYNCQFQGIANTNLAIQNVPELTFCVETLEAYGVTQASDYPSTTKTVFSSIELKTKSRTTPHPSLAWTPVNQITDTGQHVVVASNANPSGSVEIFYNECDEWLRALYADLLGRAPDPNGLASWTADMLGGASYQAVASGFLASQEYATRIVTGLYERLLGRAPDPNGLAGWVAAMESGIALQKLVLGFCTSAEYASKYPAPDLFVESLYRNLLGRGSDPNGKAGWVAALNAGRGNAYVVNGFLASTEYCTQRITELYQGLLGRDPDVNGLHGWVTQMVGGVPFQQIQNGFLTSQEYLHRAVLRYP